MHWRFFANSESDYTCGTKCMGIDDKSQNSQILRKTANFTERVTAVKSWIRSIPTHGYTSVSTCMYIHLTVLCWVVISVVLHVKQDLNVGNNHVTISTAEVSRCQRLSSEQHAESCIWLTKYDFLLVFYSDIRSKWNHCWVELCTTNRLVDYKKISWLLID